MSVPNLLKTKVSVFLQEISIHGTGCIVLFRTAPDLASVVVSGRQEGAIIFNSKWKCNQKIMKVSQVSV